MLEHPKPLGSLPEGLFLYLGVPANTGALSRAFSILRVPGFFAAQYWECNPWQEPGSRPEPLLQVVRPHPTTNNLEVKNENH